MMNPDPFKHVEDEYFRLKGQFAMGRITREQFEAALKGLMAQDNEGRYWMMGVDSGKWYVHQGGQWIEGTPPGMQPAKPMTMPERGKPAAVPITASPVPSARKTNSTTLFLLAALVIVGLGLGALFVWVNRGDTNSTGLPTAVAAVNATATPVPEAVTASETPIPTPTASATSVPSETPTSPLVSSNAPGVNVMALPLAEPTPVLAKDFVALNMLLAEKITALNQAELKFIRDLQKTSYNGRESGFAFPSSFAGSELTDQDLKDLAGKAMDVAILSDQLGEVAGKQDKGSAPAAQSADTYFAIARNALSLVVDSQELRGQLLNNYIPGAQGIQVIAEYGVQLWNAEVTDGGTDGNPFVPIAKNAQPGQTLNSNGAAQVQAQTNTGPGAVWIAQSGTQTTRTLTIPSAKAPVSPFDPQVQQGLTTAEGQSDGNKAQQVAGAILAQLGAKTDATDPAKPTQLQVPTNAVAIAEKEKIKDGKIPSFPTGKAVVVSSSADSNEDPFLQSVGLNGEQPPKDTGKVTVQDAPPLVTLTISSIQIEQVNQRPKGSGSFEADVVYSFIVDWNTTLASPRFNLDCVSRNSQVISAPSGTKLIHATSAMILYPGAVDAYCNASTIEGTQLGSTNIRFLVGDAAEATQRAQQVETDASEIDATLTAEAQGTENATQTQVAGTAQAVGTVNALETEVAATNTAEFKLTASAFETKQAQPPPVPDTPTTTPTFTPLVVDTVSQPGDVMAISTKVVLQRGHLYRFTFSGRVNLINPTKSAAAHELPEHVNGVAIPASDIIVVEGTGSVATITCGGGESDPENPGGYTITVEDLGPQ